MKTEAEKRLGGMGDRDKKQTERWTPVHRNTDIEGDTSVS